MSMKITCVAIAAVCLWGGQANALECATGQTPSQMAQYITERVRPAFANEQLDIQLTPIGGLPAMASPRVRLLSTSFAQPRCG